MVFIILSFLVVGVVVGILAGMFGFGGGVVVVPAIETFISIYRPEFLAASMQIAVATSLFVMIFTSLKTTYAHHKAKNIIWSISLKLKVGLIVGTIVGAAIASYLSSSVLKVIFIVFLLYTILKLVTKMFSNAKNNISDETQSINKPSSLLLYIYGLFTGFVSVVLGIGGSIIIVPFLRARNYRLTNAAAIAASIVPFLALFGTVSYMVAGLHYSLALPEFSIGFVYIPVAISLIFGSFIGVSIGVGLSGKIPQKLQNKIYLALMFVILAIMIL